MMPCEIVSATVLISVKTSSKAATSSFHLLSSRASTCFLSESDADGAGQTCRPWSSEDSSGLGTPLSRQRSRSTCYLASRNSSGLRLLRTRSGQRLEGCVSSRVLRVFCPFPRHSTGRGSCRCCQESSRVSLLPLPYRVHCRVLKRRIGRTP